MVSQLPQLQAQPRTTLGKRVKRLRLQGLTPIHLYGRGIDPLALQTDSVSLRRILTQVGRNRPISVEVAEEKEPYIALVRDIQFHPLDNSVLHVDLLRLELTETTEVEVPIILQGEAPAVRMLNGSLFHALRTVLVRASPLEVPQQFSVDISILDDFDKVIHVADLPAPPAVTIVTNPEELIARVTPPVTGREEALGAVEAEVAPAAETGDETPAREDTA